MKVIICQDRIGIDGLVLPLLPHPYVGVWSVECIMAATERSFELRHLSSLACRCIY